MVTDWDWTLVCVGGAVGAALMLALITAIAFWQSRYGDDKYVVMSGEELLRQAETQLRDPMTRTKT